MYMLPRVNGCLLLYIHKSQIQNLRSLQAVFRVLLPLKGWTNYSLTLEQGAAPSLHRPYAAPVKIDDP